MSSSDAAESVIYSVSHRKIRVPRGFLRICMQFGENGWVVVLSSSKSDDDVVKSYELHANAYILKPVDFHQFMKIMRAIEDFWFVTAKLPSRNG